MRALACLATAVCLVLSVPLSASGQVSVGVQGGLSLAELTGDGVPGDLHSRKGIALGVFLEKSFSDMLSFQPELLYVQKGGTDSGDGFDVTMKLNYVEVPLLLKIKIPTEGSVSPYILVGPAVGFKAGCKIGGEDEGVSVDVDCDDELKFKSFDLGGLIGAGVGFPAGSGEVVLGARYNLGLIRVDDYDDDEPVKNRAFSFLVGYRKTLGG